MSRTIILIERPISLAAAPIVVTQVQIARGTPDVIMHDDVPYIRTNRANYYARARYAKSTDNGVNPMGRNVDLRSY